MSPSNRHTHLYRFSIIWETSGVWKLLDIYTRERRYGIEYFPSIFPAKYKQTVTLYSTFAMCWTKIYRANFPELLIAKRSDLSLGWVIFVIFCGFCLTMKAATLVITQGRDCYPRLLSSRCTLKRMNCSCAVKNKCISKLNHRQKTSHSTPNAMMSK